MLHKLRPFIQKALNPIAKLFPKLSPNAVTIFSLFVAVLASVFFYFGTPGYLIGAVALIFFSGFLDLFDGVLARSQNRESKKGDITYSFEEINNILGQKKEEEKKIYSRDVKIDCNIDQKEFYYYEKALLKCKIKNIGNTVLKSLNVCFESECSKADLGIVQEKSFNYTVEKSVTGNQESIFKVKNAVVSKAEYIGYNILDEPEIKINEIESPDDIEYNDQFKISFLLSKESASIPYNLEITLSRNNFKKTWTLKELSEDRKFVINLLGKNLRKGLNEFDIIVKYEDGNARPYETKETFSVELTNVTLIQNIMLALNQFVLFLENLVS